MRKHLFHSGRRDLFTSLLLVALLFRAYVPVGFMSAASAALTYQNERGWRLSTDARWVSATSWTSADHTDPGFPYQAAADPHFVMDLAATYPIRDRVQVYLQPQPPQSPREARVDSWRSTCVTMGS
jgi:hypothetical protein